MNLVFSCMVKAGIQVLRTVALPSLRRKLKYVPIEILVSGIEVPL